MESYRRLTAEQLAPVRYVLSDIDGTLTDEGRFPSRALQALEDLAGADYKTVLVSGGSAGTALHIIRAWPVDAVVTESGAMVYYWDDQGRLAEFIHPDARRAEEAGRLSALGREILEAVPGARMARDQFTRRFDLAFDHHEDRPCLSMEKTREIAGAARRRGASVRISSIHVNCWFGNYDKKETAELFFREVWGLSLAEQRARSLYVGDALNDQAMFAFFPLSVGVSSVRQYLAQMKNPPAYITDGGGGAGFAELAERLLEASLRGEGKVGKKS